MSIIKAAKWCDMAQARPDSAEIGMRSECGLREPCLHEARFGVKDSAHFVDGIQPVSNRGCFDWQGRS